MPRSRTDAALLLGMLAGLALAPMVPTLVAVGCVGVIFVLTGAALWRRSPAVARVGVLLCTFFVMVAYPPMRNTWPLPMLLTIGVYLAVVRFVPWLREGSDFWKRGRTDAAVVGVALGFVVIASVALILWARFLDPDLTDLHALFPHHIPLPLIVGGGVLFSIFNALGEEFLWRGAILEALDRTLGRGWLPVVLQAASFGLAHIMGFPRGWIGVALATVYGLMMGIVRRRSRGMLAPIVAHVFADMTIVGILVYQVL